ncbi:hypothetical protein [Microcystis sp.]|uniref:hypothetical protein n=1 Tax=Microcystis sp. TaxID=1127 RepID=UPI00391A1BD3
MPIVFDLERANQLSLLPDKDLVDLCPLLEPYQVTKNRKKGILRLSPLNRPPIAAVLKKTLSTRLTIINTVA